MRGEGTPCNGAGVALSPERGEELDRQHLGEQSQAPFPRSRRGGAPLAPPPTPCVMIKLYRAEKECCYPLHPEAGDPANVARVGCGCWPHRNHIIPMNRAAVPVILRDVPEFCPGLGSQVLHAERVPHSDRFGRSVDGQQRHRAIHGVLCDGRRQEQSVVRQDRLALGRGREPMEGRRLQVRM